ncbi:F-box domain containing protein [Trema orientale]|uniref:F-box domain containing protein n=1 Tax=Trema orientale TaxID=63057 RepID=A0A2P5EVC5_TREOI|nr:F-box domain containing protein [Trema orientale]
MEIDHQDFMDQISDLPDHILHHIISFLSRRCAARTCILSKHWNYIWNSYPILEFPQYSIYPWRCYSSPEIRRGKFRDFIKIVDSSIKRFTPFKLRVERFYLEAGLDHDDDSMLPTMVDRWIEFAMKNGVREIGLLFDTRVTESRFYVLPETTFVTSSSSYVKYCATFHSLRKLTLARVHMSEKMMKDITRNCPEIHSLILLRCVGLKNLEISKVEKLEVVEVTPSGGIRELERVDIDAPKLRRFTFSTGFESDLPCSISLSPSHNLKVLALSECEIADDFFQMRNNLITFPLLEMLRISRCQMLRRIRMSAPRLRWFSLFACENIELIEMDAPTLSDFRLYVYRLPVLLLKNVPCRLKISYVFHSTIPADASWFLELRTFVGTLTQSTTLELKFYEDVEVSFDLQELQGAAIPPPLGVEHLILDLGLPIRTISKDQLATLIDGLLWSCHPKTISYDSCSCSKMQIMELLLEKLFNKENPECCNTFHIKCWCHYLKSAQILDSGGTKYEKLKDLEHFLDELLSPTKGFGSLHEKLLMFELEWDFGWW